MRLQHNITRSHNHITHYPSSHHITLTTISFISFTLYSTSRHTITTTIIYYINTIQYSYQNHIQSYYKPYLYIIHTTIQSINHYHII
nr:MAG TPA: hypothetical protein [Caudoviricetes sp.]